ncbi:hypothetical protein GCM10010174_84630 [Kutzneria viridogrisea]
MVLGVGSGALVVLGVTLGAFEVVIVLGVTLGATVVGVTLGAFDVVIVVGVTLGAFEVVTVTGAFVVLVVGATVAAPSASEVAATASPPVPSTPTATAAATRARRELSTVGIRMEFLLGVTAPDRVCHGSSGVLTPLARGTPPICCTGAVTSPDQPAAPAALVV